MEKEGSALYLCPACGAFISESSTKCPNCGEVLEAAAEEGAPQPDELSVKEQVDLLELEVAAAGEKTEDDSEPVTLYLCSECGAFTGGSARTCPNCGASMLDGEDEPEPPVQVDSQEAEILDMLVPKEPEPEVDEGEKFMESLKKLEDAEDVVELIEALPYTDPDKKYEPLDDLDLVPPDDAASALTIDIDELIASDDGTEPQHPGGDDVRPGEKVPEPDERDNHDTEAIAICSSCGAFVSETAQVCNVCGVALQTGGRFVPKPKPEVQIPFFDDAAADSTLRSLLGVKEDAELDDEAGKRFQSDGSLGLCTLCGAFISQEASVCPVCGTHIEDMPEFLPSMDVAGPEKTDHGLAICPHCGVFIQEGATECMSCVKPIPEGAHVEKYESEPVKDQADTASNILKTFLGVEKALEMGPTKDPAFRGLDICPDCGAFVSMDAVVCSICGNPLFEGADEIADLEMQIGKLENRKCPNCGTKIDSAATECPGCLMAFTPPEDVLKAESLETSNILDIDLDKTLGEIEAKYAPSRPAEHEVVETPDAEVDELSDLLVSEEISDDMDVSQPFDVKPLAAEPEAQLPGDQPNEMLDAVPELVRPETEALEFIEDESLTGAEPEERVEETFIESQAEREIPAVRDLSEFGHTPPGGSRSGNWGTLVYVSVAAICFFLISYLLVPGDYAPGLAVIFGTFSLFGVFLIYSEKGVFFKGDARHAGVFFAGIMVAVAVLLHWPMGLWTSDTAFPPQPGFDIVLFSISIIMVSIGMLWIRARVRYIFTWFCGTFLLFLGTLLHFTYGGWGADLTSPVMLVCGLGGGLVFLSLIFLLYERALSTSIESDIVRGDAHYLKREYRKALDSYDDALSKAQIKKVDVLGSPMIEYDVPWYSKGSALILMGNFEEGIKCLDMALAINPNNEVTWVNKGNAHSKLGEHGIAKECYDRAIECNPFYEIAWNNLGNAFARQRDFVEALRHYNRALKINPKYDDAWINKGYVLAKMGRKDAAVKCLNHVGSRARGKPPVLDKDVHSL